MGRSAIDLWPWWLGCLITSLGQEGSGSPHKFISPLLNSWNPDTEPRWTKPSAESKAACWKYSVLMSAWGNPWHDSALWFSFSSQRIPGSDDLDWAGGNSHSCVSDGGGSSQEGRIHSRVEESLEGSRGAGSRHHFQAGSRHSCLWVRDHQFNVFLWLQRTFFSHYYQQLALRKGFSTTDSCYLSPLDH